MANWQLLHEQYCPPPSSHYPSYVPDSSQLLPSNFISVLKRRYNAHVIKYRQIREQAVSDRSGMISIELIEEAISRIEQLRAHYQLLLSDKEKLEQALAPFPKDSVLWVQPAAQKDFIAFVTALWESSSHPRITKQQIEEIMQWEQALRQDNHIIRAGLETATETYNTLHEAFQVFQDSLNRILHIYEAEKSSTTSAEVFPSD